MQNYVAFFLADPLYYFGALFSFFAAIAFVTFLGGFLGGVPHLITFSEDEEHMVRARTRAVWGVGWLLILFGCWEIIQVLMGAAPFSRLLLVVILFSILWVPWLTEQLKKIKSST